MIECPICYDKYEDVTTFPCKHFVCSGCFDDLKLNRINKCPLCRVVFQDLPNNQFSESIFGEIYATSFYPLFSNISFQNNYFEMMRMQIEAEMQSHEAEMQSRIERRRREEEQRLHLIRARRDIEIITRRYVQFLIDMPLIKDIIKKENSERIKIKRKIFLSDDSEDDKRKLENERKDKFNETTMKLYEMIGENYNSERIRLMSLRNKREDDHYDEIEEYFKSERQRQVFESLKQRQIETQKNIHQRRREIRSLQYDQVIQKEELKLMAMEDKKSDEDLLLEERIRMIRENRKMISEDINVIPIVEKLKILNEIKDANRIAKENKLAMKEMKSKKSEVKKIYRKKIVQEYDEPEKEIKIDMSKLQKEELRKMKSSERKRSGKKYDT